MSKSFLTIAQAYTKLGLSGGGNNWIRKSELIATGKCDASLLEKYGDNDFVVDDVIVKKSSSIIYEIHDKTFSGKTSDKLLKPFNPSKPFKIQCSIIWKQLNASQSNCGFVIVNGSVNLTGCKANTNNGWVGQKTYWFSADDLGEFHYADPAIGKTFTYEFSYNGDHRILEENAIANGTLVFRDEYTKLHYPRNLESDVIWFCRDPRNSELEVTNLYINYLIIEQD